MWTLSEERLFERFRRRRDAGSLARVFDRTAPALMRLALHLSGDRHAAEDLVQQTFLTAIEKADRWDPERGLFPWLVGILTNRARLHQRAHRRQPDVDRLAGREPEQPSDTAANRELVVAVETAIAELGDTYRPVLSLHLFHGLNAKEIAAALGRPAGSVRTQLVRGLEHLRRALPVGLGVAMTATVATAATAATAAVRGRLLTRFAPDLAAGTAGATGTASLLLGGQLMKKWLLLAPIALIGALIYWQTTAIPDGLLPDTTPENARPLTAEQPDAADHSATKTKEDPSLVRAAVDPARTADPATGDLTVKVRFANPRLSAVGIWVRMRPEPWERGAKYFGARVDANGQVRFTGIPPGKWQVEAESSGVDVTDTLSIEAGSDQVHEMKLEHAIAAEVRVVDEARRPVADAEVWVCMPFHGRVWPMAVTTRVAARTDAQGRAIVPAGPESRIGARKAGYAASTATKASAAKGEEVLLMLRPGPGSIRGVVVDDDGEPVAGAAVYVNAGRFDERGAISRAADGRASAASASVYTETDASGAFAIEGLAAARYHVIAIARGVLDVELDVDVRAHDATPLRIEMRRWVKVTVRTTRADGTPISGLLVYGWDPDGKLVGGGSITDRNGVFTFGAPRDGYRVEVKRERTLLAERRSESRLTGPVDVGIVIDEHLIVRGKLVDEQGAPVAGWRVVAIPDTASESDVSRALAFAFDAATKKDGRFEIWGELRETLQVAARGTGLSARDLVRERNVRLGTDDLEIVIPTGKLPRSVLTGRVVDANGRLLKDAKAHPLGFRKGANGCANGVVRIPGLRHGKQSFHITAPGFGSRRLQLDLQKVTTDVGDIVLHHAVELRVRPVFPAGTEWLGPLPRASIRTAAGRSVWPQPTPKIEGGRLVFTDLPPGEYVLQPHRDEQIVTDPVPFELLAGSPKKLDWPVRVGRKRLLMFTDPDKPAPTDSLLQVKIVDAKNATVVDKQVKSWSGKWVLRHSFVPGTYRVTGKNAAGHAFAGTFAVRLDQGASEKDMQVAVPVKR